MPAAAGSAFGSDPGGPGWEDGRREGIPALRDLPGNAGGGGRFLVETVEA
jgi:hypothetical protein